MRRNRRQPRNALARDQWAELLSHHLNAGQRPTGRGEPWNPTTFADALSKLGEEASAVAESNVRSWLAGSAPDMIEPILQVLFGDNKDYVRLKAELRDAWLAVKGRGPQPGTDDHRDGGNVMLDWDDRSERAYVNGVALRWHRPRRGNEQDTLYAEATLRIGPDDLDPEKGDIVLGLREALLAIVSKRYRTAKGSMVGEREHDNFQAAADGAKVVNPIDGLGRINGDLLGDTHVAVLEPHADGPEEVTAYLLGGRRAFIVTKRDTAGRESVVSDENKDAVVNALINDRLPKQRPLGRLLLARANMRRKPLPEC
jgi:hypothetical protein